MLDRILLYGDVLLALVIISVLLPWIGFHMLARRQSLHVFGLTQGLSFSGLVMSSFGWSFALSSIALVPVAALFFVTADFLQRKFLKNSSELLFAWGLFWMASASLWISFQPTAEAQWSSYLFGDIATLSTEQAWLGSIIGLFLGTYLFLTRKSWLRLSLESEMREFCRPCLSGSIFIQHLTLFILITWASLQIGFLLSLTLLILPALALSKMKTTSVWKSILIILGLTQLGALTGFLFSLYETRAPSSGSIVIAISLCLFLPKVWKTRA
jgi:ABC-type Mn2+/Zn2+ transport system permease subunit